MVTLTEERTATTEPFPSLQKRFIHRLLTQHAIYVHCCLACLVAGRNTLGGGSLRCRTGYGTVQTVLIVAVHSHAQAQPAVQQNFSNKWGAAGWGGIAHVYV